MCAVVTTYVGSRSKTAYSAVLRHQINTAFAMHVEIGLQLPSISDTTNLCGKSASGVGISNK